MTVPDEFWTQALRECEAGIRNDALWAKAFVACAADEKLTSAAYLQERAKQLYEFALREAVVTKAKAEQDAAKLAQTRERAAQAAKSLIATFLSGQRLSIDELRMLVAHAALDADLLQARDRLRGRTLAHLCAQSDLRGEINALLSLGADSNAPDGNGRPPTYPDGNAI